MKVNCLSCGFSVTLDDAYDDYSGDIKCYACDSMLQVIIEEERIKSVKLVAAAPREPRHAR
ncbi:MAG TPA: hypothetical protein VGH29_03095 [Candidatus Binataceae bacterium]|jgi:hypothetical protein